ncbi:MAG TPA: glycine--tRNA ligase subunit beta [Clostridia bacterium]|nr:glycine--tRNA ligase subunit beta [Clostridia bacterium]
MAKDLLLEIGTEEIPAKFLPAALKQLAEISAELLKENRLSYTSLSTFATPRRIVLLVNDLAEKQEGAVKKVKGPAAKSAFTEQGEPTKAALGSAKSQGVDVADLRVETVEGGQYVFAVKVEESKSTLDILPELMVRLISSISFPKSMRWGDKDIRFARPIRWLVNLYGDQKIDFSLDGIRPDNFTYGHRFLSKGKLEIKDINDYFSKLEENYVILDQNKRQEEIKRQILNLAREQGGEVLIDQSLLEEVTFLVEYPTALCGKFEEDYLKLPKEVLITTMREHQKYFPVVDKEGKLLPLFITVRNGGKEHLEIVQAGNEKVLRARLADAKFFYEEDQAEPLANKVERLKQIVFQESLGTVYEKTKRIVDFAAFLAKNLKLSEELQHSVQRAAWLAKADLVTNMVYEFPELQGIMGREYAYLSNEPNEVAVGIFEHYLPRHAEDELPQTMVGTIVSIADKMDTIAGCFGIGIIPSGSQDPYALRRQAQGIIYILLETELDISLQTLIDQAVNRYKSEGKLKRPEQEVKTEILDFFIQRIRYIFTTKGISADIVEAVLATNSEKPIECWKRANALAKFRATSSFNDLLAAFNRANNLAKKIEKTEDNPIQEWLLAVPAEKQLYQSYLKVEKEVTNKLLASDYESALQSLEELKEPINKFFDNVMVMVDDEAVRTNRLQLLLLISNLFKKIGDLSKLTTN